MAIVSISLSEQILSELDNYQKSLGFSGRSDIIRAGIRTFVADEKKKSKLKGIINAILLVIHYDEADNIAAELGSEYEDVITTKMHSKFEGNKCMDLFVLRGDANEITKMTNTYKNNRHMNSVELVTF